MVGGSDHAKGAAEEVPVGPVELPGLQKRQEPTAAERVAGLLIKSIQDWLINLDKREIPVTDDADYMRGVYAGLRLARYEGEQLCSHLVYAAAKEASDL